MARRSPRVASRRPGVAPQRLNGVIGVLLALAVRAPHGHRSACGGLGAGMRRGQPRDGGAPLHPRRRRGDPHRHHAPDRSTPAVPSCRRVGGGWTRRQSPDVGRPAPVDGRPPARPATSAPMPSGIRNGSRTRAHVFDVIEDFTRSTLGERSSTRRSGAVCRGRPCSPLTKWRAVLSWSRVTHSCRCCSTGTRASTSRLRCTGVAADDVSRRSARRVPVVDIREFGAHAGATAVGAAPTRGVLEGVTVLDLTWVLAGPYATRILADNGAHVVKVESRHRPDPTRFSRFSHISRGEFDPDTSGYFNNLNRNKRSITLNLRVPEGVERFGVSPTMPTSSSRISARAPWIDSASAPRRCGRNRGLIVVSMSGLGATGPWKDYVSYADVMSALAGFTGLAAGGERPTPVVHGLADIVAGHHAALATLAALERVGDRVKARPSTSRRRRPLRPRSATACSPAPRSARRRAARHGRGHRSAARRVSLSRSGSLGGDHRRRRPVVAGTVRRHRTGGPGHRRSLRLRHRSRRACCADRCCDQRVDGSPAGDARCRTIAGRRCGGRRRAGRARPRGARPPVAVERLLPGARPFQSRAVRPRGQSHPPFGDAWRALGSRPAPRRRHRQRLAELGEFAEEEIARLRTTGALE